MKYKVWIALKDKDPISNKYKTKREAMANVDHWLEKDCCVCIILTDTYIGRKLFQYTRDENARR